MLLCDRHAARYTGTVDTSLLSLLVPEHGRAVAECAAEATAPKTGEKKKKKKKTKTKTKKKATPLERR
jgi:hypothetical protein